jgi:glycerol-3-phosphate acyltransferase PlsY
MTSVFVTPLGAPPHEGVLRRAFRDMRTAAGRWWFGPFVVLLGFGFGLFAFFAFVGAPPVARSLGTAGAGVAGEALAFLEVFVVVVVRAGLSRFQDPP